MDDSYQPSERRPIASRNLAISQRIAHRLATLGVTANSISLFGMVMGVVTGLALFGTSLVGSQGRLLWLLAAAGAQLRLLANMFDGMVAIEQRTASPVGELFNEVPDRVSDSAIFVGLGYASGGNAALGWLAALLAMFTSYVRAMGKVAGAPQNFAGPMAKPQRMFVVTVISLFMAVAPSAWQWTVPQWPDFGVPAVALAVIVVGSLMTAIRRLWHNARYLRHASPKS